MPEPDTSTPSSPQDAAALFYSSDGSVLGPIQRRHLASLWDSGDLPPESLGFDPATKKWIPLGDLLSQPEPHTPAPETSLIPPRGTQGPPRDSENFIPSVPELAPLPKSRRGNHSGPKHSRSILRWQIVWILTLLLAVLTTIALFFWANSAKDERNQLLVKIDALTESLAKKDAALEKLLTSSRDSLNPDEIQGRILVRNPTGLFNAQPGIKVLLYNRRDIEKHIDETLRALTHDPNPATAARTLVNSLPHPLSSTTTDSNGFYHFRLHTPGDFVLHSNILPASGDTLLWFLSFDSTQPPHTRIDFTESNTSTQLVPGLVITPAR